VCQHLWRPWFVRETPPPRHEKGESKAIDDTHKAHLKFTPGFNEVGHIKPMPNSLTPCFWSTKRKF
jgi:hypothetical protein